MAQGQQKLLYALVARGTVVLAEHRCVHLPGSSQCTGPKLISSTGTEMA